MRLFDENRPVYKGNLHTHTTVSDGRRSPEEVIALYRSRGYDFLALTDHWRVNSAGTQEGMLVLQGVEFDTVLEGREAVHLVGVGVNEAILARVRRGRAPQDYADAIVQAGGRVIFCHPCWSLNAAQTILSVRGVTAAEIYNTMSGEPWNAGRSDSSAILDVALAKGWRGGLVAGDDAHFYDGDQCVSYIRLQADELTREGILAGLDRGAYYASQGPEFDQITYEEGVITVQCSPVERIVFYSNQFYVSDRCRVGHNQTRAEYRPGKEERFVRCVLTDAFGQRAWSNPIFL